MSDGSALGLDARELGPFLRQVNRNLTTTSGDDVDVPLRLYEHKNGTYTTHGDRDVDLVEICRIDSVHSVEHLQNGDGPPLPSLRLNLRLSTELIGVALAQLGRKVEIWHRSGTTWTVKARASPADAGEMDDLLSNCSSYVSQESALIAVRMGMDAGNRRVGVAVSQSGGREIAVGEFQDDDAFSQLESVILSSDAKEVIFCASDFSPYEASKVAELLSKCGAARSERRRSEFDATDVEADLRTLVGSSLEAVRFLEARLSMSALSCVIRFGHLLEQPSLEGNVSLRMLDSNAFMKLDSAALDALGVFPQRGEVGKATLFGLLNTTRTVLGARMLRRWLAQPLQSVSEIESRLDVVEAFLMDPTLRSRLRNEHMRRIPDVVGICRKFQRKSGASLQDVVRLYQFSARLPYIEACLEEHADGSCRSLLAGRFGAALKELSSELANFEALVETSIDLEQLDNHEFAINPNIDEVLMELKDRKDELLGKISVCYEDARSALGVDQEKLKLEKKDNLGYFFRLTRKEEKLIRGNKAFLVIETRKDGVRFANKALRHLSNEYNALTEEYNAQQSDLKRKTLEVVATYLPVFADCAKTIAEMDVLMAFACVAADAPESYCRPEILQAGAGLVIEKGRHPMVEECLEGKSFISNSVDLCKEVGRVEQGGALAILTGPNMGGKSTYIRMAGVVTLMAHVGCLVPAQRAWVPLTDRILARVGAGDNQLRGVSTFMAEMLETAAILRMATPRSLIIIDELGRGTSTYDGFGLAYAISEYIVPGVRNLHVSATTDSSGKLVFLYDVQQGACDESFGIHVAEIARFPAKVVLAAKRKAAELEDFGSSSSSHPSGTDTSEGEDRAEGRKGIKRFMKEFRALPIATMSAEEAVTSVRSLQEGILPHDNSYIQSLLKV